MNYNEKTYIFHDLVSQYDKLDRTGFLMMYHEVKEKRPMSVEGNNNQILKYMEQIFKMKTDTNIDEWRVEEKKQE